MPGLLRYSTRPLDIQPGAAIYHTRHLVTYCGYFGVCPDWSSDHNHLAVLTAPGVCLGGPSDHSHLAAGLGNPGVCPGAASDHNHLAVRMNRPGVCPAAPGDHSHLAALSRDLAGHISTGVCPRAARDHSHQQSA